MKKKTKIAIEKACEEVRSNMHLRGERVTKMTFCYVVEYWLRVEEKPIKMMPGAILKPEHVLFVSDWFAKNGGEVLVAWPAAS